MMKVSESRLLVIVLFLFSGLIFSQGKAKKLNILKQLVSNEFKSQVDSGNSIDDRVLNKEFSNSNSFDFREFLVPEAFELFTKLHIKTESDKIDFTTFFSKEDFKYMKHQLEKNYIKKWSQILRIDNYNKNISNETLFYSIPLFSKNNKFVLIYTETYNSGSLKIFKKLNKKWELFATGFVWSSN